MQVVRLDPVLDEGPHQGGQRVGVVVDAGEQHRLAHHRDPGIDEAGDRRARRVREFRRVVGVERHEHRALEALERPDQRRVDPGRIDHGHAGVEPQNPDMRDRPQRRGDAPEPPGREHERVAAGDHHLPDLVAGGDVGEGGVELGLGQAALPLRADHLAAEAEAAIDRADVERLQQHPVGIAVDDAGDGRVGLVADRVGPLLGRGDEFLGPGDELAADPVLGAGDQLGHRRGDRHGVARRHPLQRRQSLHGDEAGRGEVAGAADRSAHRAGPVPGYSATGVQITSSIRRAPVASMTSRSKPSAMPLASGIWPRAPRKSSSTG